MISFPTGLTDFNQFISRLYILYIGVTLTLKIFSQTQKGRVITDVRQIEMHFNLYFSEDVSSEVSV